MISSSRLTSRKRPQSQAFPGSILPITFLPPKIISCFLKNFLLTKIGKLLEVYILSVVIGFLKGFDRTLLPLVNRFTQSKYYCSVFYYNKYALQFVFLTNFLTLSQMFLLLQMFKYHKSELMLYLQLEYFTLTPAEPETQIASIILKQ